MKWMRFRIRTNEESEDIIISTLSEIGLEGAQIEDHAPLTAAEREQMFSDDMTENEEDDGIAYLNFFAEIDDRQMLTITDDDGKKIQKTPEEMQTAIRQQLDELKQYSDIGAGTISVDITQDIDWINNWKQYFHKFYIDDVLVIPSWETLDENDKKKAKKVLHIDPGTAFGTGMHETTQLCVRQLRKYVNAETELLDVGTGSGVLSILALMFGAKHAVGTDLDTCTIPAVHENMLANGISDKQFELLIGNIIDEQWQQHKADQAAGQYADKLLWPPRRGVLKPRLLGWFPGPALIPQQLIRRQAFLHAPPEGDKSPPSP